MKRWFSSKEFPELTVYYTYDYTPGDVLEESYEDLEITRVELQNTNITPYIDDGILKTLEDELKAKKPYLNKLDG